MLIDPSWPRRVQSESRTLLPRRTYAGSVMRATLAIAHFSPIAYSPPWRLTYWAYSSPIGRQNLTHKPRNRLCSRAMYLRNFFRTERMGALSSEFEGEGSGISARRSINGLSPSIHSHAV